MRPIKFRIWDKKNCKFILNAEIYSLQLKREEYIIQQFTGLLDVDKNEIYEGDLVEYICEGPISLVNQTKYKKGAVTWLNEGFKICEKFHGATPISDFIMCHCNECYKAGSPLKIVGNIFETKENVELN